VLLLLSLFVFALVRYCKLLFSCSAIQPQVWIKLSVSRLLLKVLTVTESMVSWFKQFHLSVILSQKKNHRMSIWQWALTNFALCPRVFVIELMLKKRLNGVDDSPLYILNIWSKSARFLRSSRVHKSRQSILSSYVSFFNPGNIRVNRCWIRSINTFSLE